MGCRVGKGKEGPLPPEWPCPLWGRLGSHPRPPGGPEIEAGVVGDQAQKEEEEGD